MSMTGPDVTSRLLRVCSDSKSDSTVSAFSYHADLQRLTFHHYRLQLAKFSIDKYLRLNIECNVGSITTSRSTCWPAILRHSILPRAAIVAFRHPPVRQPTAAGEHGGMAPGGAEEQPW